MKKIKEKHEKKINKEKSLNKLRNKNISTLK